jgi:hypothetical protein
MLLNIDQNLLILLALRGTLQDFDLAEALPRPSGEPRKISVPVVRLTDMTVRALEPTAARITWDQTLPAFGRRAGPRFS